MGTDKESRSYEQGRRTMQQQAVIAVIESIEVISQHDRAVLARAAKAILSLDPAGPALVGISGGMEDGPGPWDGLWDEVDLRDVFPREAAPGISLR